MTDPETLTVQLGARSYPIVVGQGLLDDADALAVRLRGPDAVVVTNDVVGPLYLDAARRALGDRLAAVHVLPDGEAHKDLGQVAAIIDTLVGAGANRDTTVVALGGGVVGDMAGFAAACYQRGVDFIQVPTTLLAQVDSSVGGKTGVNHPRGKNLIGAFHQPTFVLIDLATLDTLPDRELAAGLAEIIKYGLLGDAAFFGWLEDNMAALRRRDTAALQHAVRRCCEMKAAIVAADEREAGQRALLNLGHTFGHAIESVTGYGEWLHGEAVAAGMLMAARVSGLAGAELDRIRNLIAAAGLPVAPPPVGAVRLREAMQLDKKVQAGRLRLVLLRAIGEAYVTADFSAQALAEALAPADVGAD
ncbi:3-dehydroquinate synthase [Lentisalinibacter orientalis]|uniref:3-dehydroquinate synthase n=1 Tax=Lentisalinibacter orientalis TaxID=2992241 RepID=UPI003867E7F6